ncbi:MAG TPA: hypothetical protein VF476_01985, partial [Chitinophagaceae bacterium]
MSQQIKTLFLFFIISSFSIASFGQQPVKTYSKEWKQAEEYAKKNLPKSALAEVKKIYTLAKKDGQDAQTIKALVYMTGLQSKTREDNEVLSIKEVEKEITTSKEPATSILKSLLAEMYWNYLQ